MDVKMRFLYLVQSRKNSHVWEKFNDEKRTIVLGVWEDEVLPGQIDLHNTTCNSGRNKMFEWVQVNNLLEQYDYITFCDDDIEFSLGSFDDYEKTIERYKHPLFHVTYNDETDNNGWKWHTDQSKKSGSEGKEIWFTDRIDTCFFSVRSDIIEQFFPLVTMFDSKNWWISCEIFCIVVKNKNLLWAISSNIFVKNLVHSDYPKQSLSYLDKKVVNFLSQYIGPRYKNYNKLIIEI